MVFQECLGPEEARWDERASNATDHNEEATVDGTECQRRKLNRTLKSIDIINVSFQGSRRSRRIFWVARHNCEYEWAQDHLICRFELCSYSLFCVFVCVFIHRERWENLEREDLRENPVSRFLHGPSCLTLLIFTRLLNIDSKLPNVTPRITVYCL